MKKRLEKLSEGLRKNDLNDIIKNIISIDEYIGKISDKSIVIAFFSIDKEVCKDIKDYLLKTPDLEVLDIDYEDRPNSDDLYTIYIDLPRNKDKFYENFLVLIREMSKISNIKNWYMKIYGKKLLHRLTDKNLKRLLEL